MRFATRQQMPSRAPTDKKPAMQHGRPRLHFPSQIVGSPDAATPEAAHFSQILLSVLEGSSGRLTNQQRRGRLGGWIPGRLLWPCCAAPRIATVWHSLHCWGKYKSVQTIADASGLGMAHVKTVPPPLDNPRDPSGSSAPNLARTMRRHGPEAVVAYQTVPCESM